MRQVVSREPREDRGGAGRDTDLWKARPYMEEKAQLVKAASGSLKDVIPGS